MLLLKVGADIPESRVNRRLATINHNRPDRPFSSQTEKIGYIFCLKEMRIIMKGTKPAFIDTPSIDFQFHGGNS
jgi:hypothetical protein